MNKPIEIIIEPRKAWWAVDLAEIYQYRDVWKLIIKRDFSVKYKQTILGPLWFILQPLIMTGIFTVVFGNIAKIPTDGLPPFLFYLCGLLGWSYFAEVVNATSRTFTGNTYLFGKVYIPRLVVPLASTTLALLAFSIQLITFMVFLVLQQFLPDGVSALEYIPRMLGIIPLLALTAVISMGVGLWLSSLTAKYRDLTFLLGFITQLWMYATPVIYPLTQVTESTASPVVKTLIILNPMTAIVESYRKLLMGSSSVEMKHLYISAAVSVVVFISGLFLFRKTERTFMDTV